MNRRKLIMKLIPDLVVPAAIYYLLRMIGLSPTIALTAAGVYSLGRVAWVAVHQRRLNVIGLLVAVGVLVGALLTMITGDPRFLMARESIVSGALGLILLGSWALRRPLLFSLIKAMNSEDPDRVARLDHLMRTQPGFRSRLMLITLVWGAGALVESVIRIVLVYLLPLDVMAVVSIGLQLLTFGLLLGWTVRLRNRGLDRTPASDHAPAPAR